MGCDLLFSFPLGHINYDIRLSFTGVTRVPDYLVPDALAG